MKKSKIENRVTLVTIITIFLVALSIAWILSALQVDFNGLLYKGKVSQSADLNIELGTNGDATHAARLDMKKSSFWALRLAARLPFWGRLTVTAVFVLLTYITLRCLVRMLLTIQRQQHRQHRKR